MQPKVSVETPNHSAELSWPCKTDRSPSTCTDGTDITENDSTEMTKSDIAAFFNEYSDFASPSQEAKSIRFNDKVEVIEVESFSDHTVSGNLWYSEADYFAISRENLKLSWQRMNNKELVDEEQQTVRGLEHEVDPVASRQRYETQDRAFEAVMEEQDYQDRKGFHDPYAIAEAYQKHGARKSQIEAYAVGLDDFEKGMMDISKNHQRIYKFQRLSENGHSNEELCGFHSNENSSKPQ